MNDDPKFFSHEEESDPLDSLRPRGGQPQAGRINSLVRDRKFRMACVGSVFLHIVIFASALWSPSSAKYRFYGSGTAVSLVGADEIPGGSARGKSGDRPEDIVKPETSKKKKTRKIEAKKKKPPKKIVKKVVKKKKPKTKKKIVKKKVVKKKTGRKIAVKPKKKKLSKKEIARLKRMKLRRERQEKWRKKWNKQKKTPVETAKNETAQAEKSPNKSGGAGNDSLAKTVESPRQKPLKGYLGEGGGDGQGGGSLGGGSGGVARTDLDRYYGILGERIRNFFTVPPNLTDVKNFRTEIIVDVARDGAIRNLKIVKNSGNRVYDTAALRAIQRAANPSFPPPPNSVKESWLPLGFRFCGRSFCRK